MILAHSAAVELYREKYQDVQKGKIGVNIYSIWFTPLTNSIEDANATKRALDFILGWILNPLVFGDYPEIMKKNAGPKIPSFTDSQSQQVKGSYDFIGLNYYYSLYVAHDSSIPKTSPRDFTSDMFAKFTDFVDNPMGHRIIPPIRPKYDYDSLCKLLNHLKNAYGNPPIYIHENGFGVEFVDAMNDVTRVSSLSGFIRSVHKAIRDGSDVRGYFVWSFVDVYEWISGFTLRYGLYHVDFEGSGRERTPKLSAHWYRNFLQNGSAADIQNVGLRRANAHSS
ncbi:Beta-glucosidase 22 [Platanthera guangdongensis]|uniref:Beta-glucosidase 22 n=1 Tax=Platanthera guangdongensis TaxID=2320717 RepID=A0ABR2M6A7_9ASPA